MVETLVATPPGWKLDRSFAVKEGCLRWSFDLGGAVYEVFDGQPSRAFRESVKAYRNRVGPRKQAGYRGHSGEFGRGTSPILATREDAMRWVEQDAYARAYRLIGQLQDLGIAYGSDATITAQQGERLIEI